MESVLSLFIFHDSFIVSFLVLAITVVVIALLLFNHKSPESVIKNEIGGGSENIEGALRRVLGEQRWNQAAQNPDAEQTGARAADLEKELLDKDRKIAELNKQLTQGGGSHGGLGASQADNSDLLNKISELEGRLQEYEIIEDDIADLSLYRTENDRLKAELARLKAQLGAGGGNEPAEESAEAAESTEPEPTEPVASKNPVKDFVAEFEKVVISQEKLMDDSETKIKIEANPGQVLIADEIRIPNNGIDRPDVHPKLRHISPDSKEEAEVFINELKSIKKG